jgi:hypothetical protein
MFFGVQKRVERVRAALVNALMTKSVSIMQTHALIQDPSKIPWIDVARATILKDIADIIQGLGIEETPEDKA